MYVAGFYFFVGSSSEFHQFCSSTCLSTSTVNLRVEPSCRSWVQEYNIITTSSLCLLYWAPHHSRSQMALRTGFLPMPWGAASLPSSCELSQPGAIRTSTLTSRQLWVPLVDHKPVSLSCEHWTSERQTSWQRVLEQCLLVLDVLETPVTTTEQVYLYFNCFQAGASELLRQW